MMARATEATVQSRPIEAPRDDWVLPLSLDEPTRVLPDCVQWAEWGPFRCFFDGLLFNREDLARPSNCSEANCSDADLVLRAYERGGEAALSRLRGSFVVAIIDRARDIALVARDPLGSHPLFYAEAGASVVFSVTPQLLLDWPGVSRALNRAALADHLCQRWPYPQETFFAAVRRVPPGWKAVISRRRLAFARYWDPMPKDRNQWLSDEEAARFDEAFDRAVDRCIRNGPTGIFLSGGLDSISIAAVATDRARHVGHNPPLALSLAFPDPQCDERERQAAVARELGLRQYLVGFHEALGSRPLFEQSLELNKMIAAPILNSWLPAYLSLARRARLDGVRTILTGHGGDEWLGATPFLAADLIRRGALLELVQFFGMLRRSYKVPTLALARNVLWKCGLRALVARALHRLTPKAHKASRLKRLLAGDPLWVAPDAALRAEQRRRAEDALTDPDPPYGFYLREQRAGLDHPIVSWELEEQYVCGQKIGVRFLHPFLDPDIVEMLYRMPPRLLSEGGRTKGLVRGTLARRFPALGFERQRKVQATSFFLTSLMGEGPALAERAGDFPVLSALGIVDGGATRTAIRERLKRPGPLLHRIFHVVNLETWAQSQVQ